MAIEHGRVRGERGEERVKVRESENTKVVHFGALCGLIVLLKKEGEEVPDKGREAYLIIGRESG